jgi:hypothetical protein
MIQITQLVDEYAESNDLIVNVKWLVSGKNNVLETRAVREPADREA